MNIKEVLKDSIVNQKRELILSKSYSRDELDQIVCEIQRKIKSNEVPNYRPFGWIFNSANAASTRKAFNYSTYFHGDIASILEKSSRELAFIKLPVEYDTSTYGYTKYGDVKEFDTNTLKYNFKVSRAPWWGDEEYHPDGACDIIDPHFEGEIHPAIMWRITDEPCVLTSQDYCVPAVEKMPQVSSDAEHQNDNNYDAIEEALIPFPNLYGRVPIHYRDCRYVSKTQSGELKRGGMCTLLFVKGTGTMTVNDASRLVHPTFRANIIFCPVDFSLDNLITIRRPECDGNIIRFSTDYFHYNAAEMQELFRSI